MMRHTFTIGLMAAALAVGTGPVWAGQRSAPDAQAGSRTSNGDTVGSAVPRDSGGSSAGASSPGGGFSSGSNAEVPGGWMSSAPARQAQPAPRSDIAEQRRGGGGGARTGQAVPRGSAGSGGSTASSAGARDGGRDRGDGRATPTYSRPRDGRDVQGTAVERRGAVRGGGGGGGGAYYPGVIYDPYYSYFYSPYYSPSSSYWSPYGYGFGLGYFAYDPFLSGGYGRGPYGGYPYGGYGGYDPDQGSYGQGGYGSAGQYRGVGSLRLRVKPSDAQVYVDGYYTGVVDSFDGAFQRLTIEAGAHKVEIRADGYEPVQVDVMVLPDETITYKGELKRIH
ncbi:MAG: PEGA domain-containing protein [Acidobacteriota bacterium]